MSKPLAGGPRVIPTMIAGCLAVFVAQMANSMPATLIGTVQAEFNLSGAQLTWIPASFALTMVIFELTFGVLGDLFGRKQLLLGGFVVLAAGELISHFASNAPQLWIGQAIAGIGAGALYPMSLTMIAAVTPDPRARARGIALWAGCLSVGAAVAPISGGALASAGHWRTAFLVVIGVCAVGFVASLASANSTAAQGRSLDIPGQITIVVGLVALIWGLTQGSAVGFGKPLIVTALIVGVVFLVAFILIELRTSAPLIHLGLFRNRAFAVTGTAAVVGMFAYLGGCFTMTVFLTSVVHVNPAGVGVLYLVIQVPALLLVPLVARLIHSVSPRWVLTAGFACIAAGASYASTKVTTTAQWPDFIPAMLIFGVGFCLTVGSITAVAINTVPAHLAGMSSATTNLLRDFGFALGPVIIGAVATPLANNRFRDGLGSAIAHSDLHNPAAIGTLHGISADGGALAVNSLSVIPGRDGKPLSATPSAIHELALDSLTHSYQVGFYVVAAAALASAALCAVGLVGVGAEQPDAEPDGLLAETV